MTPIARIAAAILLVFMAVAGRAEQFEQFGEWRVHYIAFNASLLSPEVAQRYGLVRGRNKGLVNISAVRTAGADASAVVGRGGRVAVSGHFVNLLGQTHALDFREIDDNGSYYYLAAFDFDDAETLRFDITIELPDQGTHSLRFQQPLYFATR